MGAGLPIESWLLIAGAIGLGLGLELAFLRAQRGRRPPSAADALEPGRKGER